MPITTVNSDPKALTLTVVGDYPVSVERLWDAFSDPRQLEKFWGPESWPATFTRHDMRPGGESHYYMSGPDGTVSRGWWKFVKVERERMFEIEDGFSNEDGTPNKNMPTMRMVFTFDRTAKGSRFTGVTRFPNIEAMEEVLKMGMVEGLKSAMGQMDAVLADLASFSTNLATNAQLLSDTKVRISRVIHGTVDQVWRAHNDAALMQRWLLGPDGWTMPVCEVAKKVGDKYRYEWESVDGSQRFGFEGELLEVAPPTRAVTTEKMIGMEGPSTLNEMTLTPVGAGTLLTIIVTYPNAEVRDMILGTGMTKGMETSYVRLEREILGAIPEVAGR